MNTALCDWTVKKTVYIRNKLIILTIKKLFYDERSAIFFQLRKMESPGKKEVDF